MGEEIVLENGHLLFETTENKYICAGISHVSYSMNYAMFIYTWSKSCFSCV